MTRSITMLIDENDRTSMLTFRRTEDGALSHDPEVERSQVGILLAFDIGDDIDECDDLLDDLRAVAEGRREPFQRGWDMTMLRIDVSTCNVRAGHASRNPDGVRVPTPQLIAAVQQLRDLVST